MAKKTRIAHNNKLPNERPGESLYEKESREAEDVLAKKKREREDLSQAAARIVKQAAEGR